MTKLTLPAIALAILALAACAPKTAEEAPPAPAPVSGDEPQLRAGLWEYTITVGGVESTGIRTCADPAHAVPFTGATQCPDSKRTKTGEGSWSIQATCNNGSAGTMTLNGEMRGDMQTSYSVTVNTTISGAADAALDGSQTATLNGKWASETCPPGLKPGAIETAQGIIDSSAIKKGG
jgi:hypothetical protein